MEGMPNGERSGDENVDMMSIYNNMRNEYIHSNNTLLFSTLELDSKLLL
jgi:hypothetical protein